MRYERPTSIKRCVELLNNGNGSITLLAGGTDLMPRYEQETPLPDVLVDLKHIDELHGIHKRGDSLEIGALTTIHELLNDSRVRDQWPALAESARDFAGVQIRHRATVGGNICNASPAGDTLPPLYAFNALVRIVGPRCERDIPIQQFILGPGKVALKQGELLRSVILPKPEPESRFVKVGLRDAMAISVVNFSVAGEIKGGKFSRLNIAAGAVAPTIIYLKSYTEAVMKDAANIHDALDLIDNDISPIDDIRATARYRSRVLMNMVEMTLNEMLTGGKHE